MNSTLAQNIRSFRLAQGSSQAEIARRTEISLPAYRKLESGDSEPRAQTLLNLAQALGVNLDELFQPTAPLQHVRFRSQKSLKTRQQILHRVSVWLRDFRELEELLGVSKPFDLVSLVSSQQDPVRLALDARNAMNLRPDEPIRDICGLLENRGIKVLSIDISSDAFFGLSVTSDEGGPAVVVNTWERISVERWIFTAAHELGHLLMHRGAYDVSKEEENKKEEEDANRFAAYFLMPQKAFAEEWNQAAGLALVERVFKVKRIFHVSYRTVLYRLVNEGIVDKEIWETFQKSYARRYKKTLSKADEPERVSAEAYRAKEPEYLSPLDFKEDRLSNLVRKAVEKHVITLSRAAEILNVPLREMREIAASWVA